jgi:HAD superfamily hydrolase (TIGR01509 family)
MKPEAILFDMDGVLVDSEHEWKLLSDVYFQELIPGWGAPDFKRIVGLGVHDLHDLLVKEYGCKRSKTDCFADWEKMAVEVYTKKTSMAEGLQEILVELDRKNLPHGLVSSSPHRWIRLFLNRFGLQEEFKPIVSADDVGGRGKPEPEIYLLASRLIGVAPDRCLAVEDSEHGVRAAKSAGMRCAGFRNGNNPEQDLSLADFEIESFGELPF